MNRPTGDWPPFLTTHLPAVLTGTTVTLIVIGLLLYRTVRTLTRHLSGIEPADLLTYLAASIATSVATTGMWRVFRDVLHIGPVLRVGMFSFIELAVLTSAVRARWSLREHRSAGADGIAVWALTSLSAFLSAMDADSFPEAVFRLSAPLVAAWLWERGMHVERQKFTGQTRIDWRITPERLLVRLHLVEPTGRTAGQADTDRHLTHLALTTARVRALQDAGITGRRHRRALSRLDAAMRHAVTHTALATDPTQQQHLLHQLAALTNTRALLTVVSPAPWDASPTDAAADHPQQTRSSTDRDPINGSGSERARAASEVARAGQARGRKPHAPDLNHEPDEPRPGRDPPHHN